MPPTAASCPYGPPSRPWAISQSQQPRMTVSVTTPESAVARRSIIDQRSSRPGPPRPWSVSLARADREGERDHGHDREGLDAGAGVVSDRERGEHDEPEGEREGGHPPAAAPPRAALAGARAGRRRRCDAPVAHHVVRPSRRGRQRRTPPASPATAARMNPRNATSPAPAS